MRHWSISAVCCARPPRARGEACKAGIHRTRADPASGSPFSHRYCRLVSLLTIPCGALPGHHTALPARRTPMRWRRPPIAPGRRWAPIATRRRRAVARWRRAPVGWWRTVVARRRRATTRHAVAPPGQPPTATAGIIHLLYQTRPGNLWAGEGKRRRKWLGKARAGARQGRNGGKCGSKNKGLHGHLPRVSRRAEN
jgi:hypothetical protein